MIETEHGTQDASSGFTYLVLSILFLVSSTRAIDLFVRVHVVMPTCVLPYFS